jgi:hypothetical protein
MICHARRRQQFRNNNVVCEYEGWMTLEDSWMELEVDYFSSTS